MLRRGRITRPSTQSVRHSSHEEKPIRAMARCLEPSTHLEVDMTNFDAVLARQLIGKAVLVSPEALQPGVAGVP
jgi:hypothetical protein